MPEWPCKIEDDAEWLGLAGEGCAGLAQKVAYMRERNRGLVLDPTVEARLREVADALRTATVLVIGDDPESGD